MKTLKPSEVTEPGYYWARLRIGMDKIVHTYRIIDQTLTFQSGCCIHQRCDFTALIGPIPNPWTAQEGE